MPDAVLILGGRHPALPAARALAARGYRVIAGDGGEYSAVRYSRHCSEVWRHPSVRDPETFMTALGELLARRPDITSVFPLRDRHVALLARGRDRLPGSATVAAPDSTAVETCFDKPRMYAIAGEVDVPYAMIRHANDPAALVQGAAEVGYPCVIRPAVIGTPLSRPLKALICPDRAALANLLTHWPVSSGGLLVQRYVTGLRHNLWFAAREGRLLASLQAVALRTDRIDGTGVLVEGMTVAPDARLRSHLERLLWRLDYTGVGGAQFIVPDKGEPSFLEINPRLTGTGLPILRHCGLDLAVAAVEIASGAGRWRSDPGFCYPAGRRYAWTSRELYGLGVAMSRREVGAGSAIRWVAGALRAGIRADAHVAWEWRDPLPALAIGVRLLTHGPWRTSGQHSPEQ